MIVDVKGCKRGRMIDWVLVGEPAGRMDNQSK